MFTRGFFLAFACPTYTGQTIAKVFLFARYDASKRLFWFFL